MFDHVRCRTGRIVLPSLTNVIWCDGLTWTVSLSVILMPVQKFEVAEIVMATLSNVCDRKVNIRLLVVSFDVHFVRHNWFFSEIIGQSRGESNSPNRFLSCCFFSLPGSLWLRVLSHQGRGKSSFQQLTVIVLSILGPELMMLCALLD